MKVIVYGALLEINGALLMDFLSQTEHSNYPIPFTIKHKFLNLHHIYIYIYIYIYIKLLPLSPLPQAFVPSSMSKVYHNGNLLTPL